MMTRRDFIAGATFAAVRGQDSNPAMFANAEAYERFMGRWSRMVAPRLVDFANIPDEGRVLDIGSGTGALAFEIVKRKSRHVIGIDPSKEYIAYAMSRNPSPGRITFQSGDAQELPFADGTFAASVSLLVFNFIPDPRKALREVRRVTQLKARVSAAVWDYGERMRMLRVFWDAAAVMDPQAEKLDEKHMPLCRAGELSQLWKESGLVDIQEQPLDITMRFASFADYWDPFLSGQGPAGSYARTIRGERLLSLRSAVKRQLSITSEVAAFALPARVWAVRGTVPNHR